MLTLLFKEQLSDEQNEHLFYQFEEYPRKYEHDISADIDTKLSVYVGDEHIAQKKVDELKSNGYMFIGQLHYGSPFFHEQFLIEAGESDAPELDTNALHVSQLQQHVTPVAGNPEIKPPMRYTMNQITATHVVPPQLPTQRYVTVEQFEAMSKKAQEQLNEFSINLMSKVEAMSASAALAAGFAHDHSNYASTMNSSSSSDVGPSSAIDRVRPTPMAANFKAKNELIANGIRCEKCGKTVRDVEPISKLMMAVREHVMTHFDSENPRLKRFECRECPDYQTNFVDDFEKHLKKHGSMNSLPEKRQKLTVNLLTATHLKLIAKLSSACFPEVFEKTPPQISTILAVDTPLKAKVSVFPRLDRLYCSKYNIPYGSNGHAFSLVKID